MPEAVLTQAAAEMLDWHGSGMGVMEMSHRGKEFTAIAQEAEQDFRDLMAVPEEFHILFMQGGGLGENAVVPMNLCGPGAELTAQTDFVVTGSWSQKSAQEAARYSLAKTVASNAESGNTHIPAPQTWRLSPAARYVHVCSNETINGVEFQELPDLRALGCNAPLVVDCSSHIASRPMDWSKVGLAFAGAQKNLGPAGLTLVVVRDDLLKQALNVCPSAFNYQLIAANRSMYNTPPTFGMYMAGLVFKWLKGQGGVAAMETLNKAKAALLYEFIDASALYSNSVTIDCRSRMNVPFFLQDETLNAAFLSGAQQRGLLQLKGHKSVGGMRASIYNAMPLEGVVALVDYMRDFEKTPVPSP